ncbi:MAG: phytoene desaturase family protein [Candidatus Dormibacteria bacterium]
MTARLDAVVVGSGPNGLAAAITLAQAGRSVLVVEARDTIGGGCRTDELTLPGFRHDVCSSAHPLGVSSPFFRSIGLHEKVDFLQPDASIAHPFVGGEAMIVERDIEATAQRLGGDDKAYVALLKPALHRHDTLLGEVLGPPHIPRHPLLLARFGVPGLRSATTVASGFTTDNARAAFAGCAAHAMLPPTAPLTAAFGVLLLATAHVRGWPVVASGSQAIADALAAGLQRLGGRIETGREIRRAADLPAASVHLFDTGPRQMLDICGEALPRLYRGQLEHFRRGPGVFKIDYALDGPVPWSDPAVLRAATVHVGGAAEEIAAAEEEVFAGVIPDRPFLIAVQASVADSSRAPGGGHTLWAYCHVPHGSAVDMTERIERQLERFAPGFRDRVLARHITTPRMLEAYNPNCQGGDISGGVQNWRQFLTRPAVRWSPYLTPNPRIAICSSSSPPGGGVHGMCGYHAARAVLRRWSRN